MIFGFESNGPNKPQQFASQRGHNLVLVLAARAKTL